MATVANMASGTGSPGCCRFHAAIASIISAHHTHDADDDENQADIEPWAGGQRRIEGVKDGGFAQRDRITTITTPMIASEKPAQAQALPGSGRSSDVTATK